MTENEEATNAGKAAEQKSTKPLGEVIQIDREMVEMHLGEVVRSTVEETLNAIAHTADAAAPRASVYKLALRNQPRCAPSRPSTGGLTARLTGPTSTPADTAAGDVDTSRSQDPMGNFSLRPPANTCR